MSDLSASINGDATDNATFVVLRFRVLFPLPSECGNFIKTIGYALIE